MAAQTQTVTIGQVSTLVGGSKGWADGVGTFASFNYVGEVRISTNREMIYVGDFNNNLLRAVDVSNWISTTVVGDTAGHSAGFENGIYTYARLNGPAGVVQSSNGILFISDYYNNQIRSFDTKTGIVSSLAGAYCGLNDVGCGYSDGTGSLASFFLPGDVELVGQTLFVMDCSNNVVRSVELASKRVSTFAGYFCGRGGKGCGYADGTGTFARFSQPLAISYARGSLYIADSYNQLIRSINLVSTLVTTVAGSSGLVGLTNGIGTLTSFNYPWDLTFDGGETLYIADAVNNVIRSINLTSSAVSTVAGSAIGAKGFSDGLGSFATFNFPGAVSYGQGLVYIADQSNNRLRALVVPQPAAAKTEPANNSKLPATNQNLYSLLVLVLLVVLGVAGCWYYFYGRKRKEALRSEASAAYEPANAKSSRETFEISMSDVQLKVDSNRQTRMAVSSDFKSHDSEPISRYQQMDKSATNDHTHAVEVCQTPSIVGASAFPNFGTPSAEEM